MYILRLFNSSSDKISYWVAEGEFHKAKVGIYQHEFETFCGKVTHSKNLSNVGHIAGMRDVGERVDLDRDEMDPKFYNIYEKFEDLIKSNFGAFLK